MENNELLYLLTKGDERAYELIFKQFYRPLSLFANGFVQDIEVAKDIVQELFFQLFEKRSDISVHTNLKSFLYQSVKNRCLNHIKMNKLHEQHHSNIIKMSDEESVDHSEIERVELEDRIALLVEKLPTQTRRVFELSRYDGISNQEIADSLQISKRTVETHISLALKRLREGLADVVFLLGILVINIFRF